MIAGMNLLPFEPLPPYRPRAFVPEKAGLGDWGAVAPVFDQLEAEAARASTPADLERWLRHESNWRRRWTRSPPGALSP